MVQKQHIPRKDFQALHDLLTLNKLGTVRVQSFDSSLGQRTLSLAPDGLVTATLILI